MMGLIDEDAHKRRGNEAGGSLETHRASRDVGGLNGRRVASNLVTFALIPSVLFWAMVIMVLEGNIAGAVQMIGVSISAGFVGWSLR
jgi:hypothetical protein